MRFSEIHREPEDGVETTNEITRWETDTKKGERGILSNVRNMVKSTPSAEYDIGMGYTMRQYKYGSVHYYATFDESKKLAGYVELDKKGKAMQVQGVYAGKNNTYPMYKVYAYLVKKLGIILMSDKVQSDAGEAVWNKLSTVPGITVFGWNTKTRRAINLGDKLDHDTRGDTHTGQSVWTYTDNLINPDPRAKDVVLIAVRKE